MTVFVGNSLWHLIWQSDFVTKCVLLVLLVMSVACWAIFLCKFFLGQIKKRQLRLALGQVNQAESVEDVVTIASACGGTLPGYILSKNLVFLKSLISRENGDAHWDMMQHHMDGTVDTASSHQESYLSILSTCAAIAPLIGLFGTVWGLVHAFISMSEKQAADITTVAPGIAEALITTLVGLMVAIPAFVMYNILLVQIRKMDNLMVQMSDKLSFIMQSLFVK